MTQPVDDSVDPRSLPLFESRARLMSAGRETLPGPRRPGRVRSGFTLHALDADRAISAPHTGAGSVVDWGLVAAFRSLASELLTKAMADDRSRMERAAQEALGRSIILELLEAAAAEAVTSGNPTGSLAEQDGLATAVFNALFRMGRLQPLVEDDRIENIVITGFDRVWLELLDGTVVPGPPVADSDQELIDFLVFLASRSEVNARPFSQAQPRLHLRLDDGSRLAATAWVNPRPSVVIRRHRLTRVGLDDLVGRGSLTPIAASFLTAAVRARLSVVVSGAQGFGKTTMARALCGAFDPMEAIATFETEYELGLHEMPERHAIVHAWEARIGSGERGPDGKMAGEFSIAEALYDSFRFNVSRQIVGEIRGPEVWPMIKAMESGSGSISTTHAGDAEAAMRKLITCAMESGPQVTHELAARKLADTIDLIVQLDMDTDQAPGGTRRRRRWVKQIVAITAGEKEKGYAATTIFASRNTRVAVAHTVPDELRRLERYGFDLAGFLTEARQYGAGS